MIIGFIMFCMFVISTGFGIVALGIYLLLHIGIKLAGFGTKCISDKIEEERQAYKDSQKIIEQEVIVEEPKNYAIFDVKSKRELRYTDTYEKAYWLKRSYQQKNPSSLVMVKKIG